MPGYRLEIKFEDEASEITLIGLKRNYCGALKSSSSFTRSLASLYYGTEFSNEALELAEEVEKKFLPQGSIKHYVSAWPNWIKALGQYIFNEIIPSDVSKVIRSLPRDSLIQLEIGENVSHVPWELMHTGTDFLCLEHIIGRVKGDMGDSPKPASGPIPMLMVADPTGDLYGAQNEANYIISQLRGSNLRISRYGAEIRKKDYLQLLESGKYRIVHYSGHSASSTDPGKSHHFFLDGPCYAENIEALDMISPPFLVFSNSCQSAEDSLEKEETGNTSLAGAYLKAGVKGCMAAIWLVSDLGASNFASDFYRFLLFGASLGEAVLRARRAAFKRWGYQDFIWGSYILYGNPEVRMVLRN
ncbi:CHAT domain-containing protein [Candidatus Bathyarchaeota archaeon]|nr:CHAT domain-containing protein [Candidatus Bathyarchaeota archaeon]